MLFGSMLSAKALKYGNFPWERKRTMTNTIGLKITCFFVIIYSDIDQGYMGLSLASCQKDEIRDLRAELGLIWDHFRALVPIGTKSQSWDIITSTVLVIWIFSFPRPNFPKPRLFSETKFFRNRNRYFFSETKFSETETETLKDLAKVSKPRSFETEMSISATQPMDHGRLR